MNSISWFIKNRKKSSYITWMVFIIFVACLYPLWGLDSSSKALGYQLTPTPILLKQLRQVSADHGIHVGVTDDDFTNPIYQSTIPSEFNSLTTENLLKFEYIHPCPPDWLISENPTVLAWVNNYGTDRPGSQYDCTLENSTTDEWEWADADFRINWALQNNIDFRIHTLVWKFQNPGWISHSTVVLLDYQRERIMKEHIRRVIEHYCIYPNLYQIDVVNEAINPDGSLSPGPWTAIPDYIDKSFREAASTLNQCGRSDVILYYNDFDFEYGGQKADAIYDYLSQLIERLDPTPIGGIGFQTHSQRLYATTQPQDVPALISTMDRFTIGLGLEVSITETDLPIMETNRYEWYDSQAMWFSGRMKACLLAVNCKGFTTWGSQDGTSWRNGIIGDVDPLMFHDAKELVSDPQSNGCFPSETDEINNQNYDVYQTSDVFYCPKPAYGSVYDSLDRGLISIFLPMVYLNNSTQTSEYDSFAPYPAPESTPQLEIYSYPPPP